MEEIKGSESNCRSKILGMLKEIEGRISSLESRQAQLQILHNSTHQIVEASKDDVKIVESYLAKLILENIAASAENKVVTTRSTTDAKVTSNPNNRNKTPVKGPTGPAKTNTTATKSRNDTNKDNIRDKSNIKQIAMLNTADKTTSKMNSTLGTLGKKSSAPPSNLKTSATTTAIGFSKIKKQDDVKPKEKTKANDNKSENKSVNTQIKQSMTSPASNANLKKKPAGKDVSTTKSAKTALSKASTNNTDKKANKETKEVKEEATESNVQNEIKSQDSTEKVQKDQSEPKKNNMLQCIEEEEKPILEEPKLIEMMKDSPPQSEISKPLSIKEEMPHIQKLSKSHQKDFNLNLNRIFEYLDEKDLLALSYINKESLRISADNRIKQLLLEKDPLVAKIASLNSVSKL